jgi:hypothetical protein
MAKVDVRLKQSEAVVIDQGDILVYGGTPYLAAQVGMGELKLIGLYDGNRQTDFVFEMRTPITPQFFKQALGLNTYDKDTPYHLIKRNDYRMIIEEV